MFSAVDRNRTKFGELTYSWELGYVQHISTCDPAFSFGVCARHKILGRRSILDKLIVCN